MNDPLLLDRLRTAVQSIVEQASRRAKTGAENERALREAAAAAEREFEQASEQLQAELERAESKAQAAYEEKSQAITRQFASVHGENSGAYEKRTNQAWHEFERAKKALETALAESNWTTDTVLEADCKEAKDELSGAKRRVGGTIREMEVKQEEIANLIKKWNRQDWISLAEARASDAERQPEPLQRLEQCLKACGACYDKMNQLLAPRLLRGYRLLLIFSLLWIVSLAPALQIRQWYYWLGASLGIVTLLGLTTFVFLNAAFRRRFTVLCAEAKQALADGKIYQKRALEESAQTCQQKLQRAKDKHAAAKSAIQQEHEQRVVAVIMDRHKHLEDLKNRFEPVLASLEKQRDEKLAKLENARATQLDSIRYRHESQLEAAAERKTQSLRNSETEYDASLDRITRDWEQAIESFTTTVGDVNGECARLFPDWSDLESSEWHGPTTVPLGLPFGRLELCPELIPYGIPVHEKLDHLAPPLMSAPALLGFPLKGSVLIKADGNGREPANAILQEMMLRCLAGVPPTKVRFTIIDPVGLGGNFSGFAHLADYDEKLVTSRIWTERDHVEQRLADLTEHIENVIQKYLRNQFNSLEEYNRLAGEVAEPYRVLVISHFPVNFSEEAAQRLLSIASSGARCGIHTFIMVDTSLPLPRNFDLRDLEKDNCVLEWQESAFAWTDDDFGRFPFTPSSPPDSEAFTRIVRQCGEAAQNAGRVEVPFRTVAPPKDEWWSGSTRDGIRVALGRAGATRKQLLELGRGTAQHVLIAGKTGSGKSTLLHALILQLCLTYGTDELELYLIDFKKGVEFKTYANSALPHAAVIGIESEREFGLSVLQRLDAELKLRGERFRALGVNDLPAFRAAAPGEPMPRVLLIVDEFQEFFVDDDRIAQEAALLLDRLVRQGRAFGIHVLLGSQTLGGAYSLARSTIDQMAIRIALQCSEADGHLILSKDNSAARLLARPGEAIYNNANGLLEGNNVFQIVWLPEREREELLRQLQARFHSEQSRPQIVFEGNAPAEIGNNRPLRQLLEGSPANGEQKDHCAWLGDAIAIKDPTAATFRAQSGSNLLIVGQQAETALAVVASSVLSLAAQLGCEDERDENAQFYLLCNDTEEAGALLFQRLADVLPQTTHNVGWRDLADALDELARAIERRSQARERAYPPLFLCVYGLHRFRDLRRDEDDYGFGRRDEDKATPAKQFVHVLREGPEVGVHVLAWCDTLNNLHRTFDRQTLKEFDLRVLFQMNANDSSNLIDSPIASKLGLYRALFYAENEGREEKFRPYNLPTDEWLEQVKEKLHKAPAARI